MTNSKFKIQNFRVLCGVFLFVFFISAARAQSTDQSYPTAITSNQISGRIAARDIGDSRLTNYFYTFSGNQGDIFINVQTANFNGDIDIFTADNLKPLTKITIYAQDTANETGRVVYLRQPTKLILRIQGRSPNDDAATFQIKFAGSFEPSAAVAENVAPELPTVKSDNQSDVRVNSVGTIIEVKPKPTPTPKVTIARNEAKPRRKKPSVIAENKTEPKENQTADEKNQPSKNDANNSENTENGKEEINAQTTAAKNEPEIEKNVAPVVVVTENAAKSEESKAETTTPKTESVEKPAETTAATATKRRAGKIARAAVKPVPKAATPKVKAPNPLENVRLIILLKDGTRIERAMSEVVKVGVDRGVLTVIANDGTIKRYSILDVAKMTIE